LGEGIGLEPANTAQRKWLDAFQISPTESLLLALVLFTQLTAGTLALALQRDVDWPPFLSGFAAALGLVAIGAYVRRTKARPRIALALISVGTFAGFIAASTVLIYGLLPLPNPMIDDALTRTGHWVGYDWQKLMAAMTAYPAISRLLGHVYHSALPQMLVAILVLAAYGQALALYRFLLVGMMTLVMTVSIWWVWPSVGYVGTLPFPREVLIENGFTFGAEYSAYLTRLIQEGPGRITPDAITGVVGFPSYHVVMVCIVIWYCRRTLLFWPILAVNLAMIPATLVHGGHHLIDLLGGLVVFAVCGWLASRVIRTDA
jgi:hypothetical protein